MPSRHANAYACGKGWRLICRALSACAAARRCLLDDFALAAEAEHWHLLNMERAQARQPRSPMHAERAAPMPSPQLLGTPEDCMTSPQAVMMSASPDDTWQPGRLREVMQVRQHSLATIVSVASLSILTMNGRRISRVCKSQGQL